MESIGGDAQPKFNKEALIPPHADEACNVSFEDMEFRNFGSMALPQVCGSSGQITKSQNGDLSIMPSDNNFLSSFPDQQPSKTNKNCQSEENSLGELVQIQKSFNLNEILDSEDHEEKKLESTPPKKASVPLRIKSEKISSNLHHSSIVIESSESEENLKSPDYSVNSSGINYHLILPFSSS